MYTGTFLYFVLVYLLGKFLPMFVLLKKDREKNHIDQIFFPKWKFLKLDWHEMGHLYFWLVAKSLKFVHDQNLIVSLKSSWYSNQMQKILWLCPSLAAPICIYSTLIQGAGHTYIFKNAKKALAFCRNIGSSLIAQLCFWGMNFLELKIEI